MLIPVALLIFFVFYLLVQSGTSEDADQTFQDKIMNADSYQSLLFGTSAAGFFTGILYLIQYVNYEKITFVPPVSGWFNRYIRRDRTSEYPNALMNVKELVESFIKGMTKIFPSLIVLTLAWASGSMMQDIGADRLFSSWILSGIDPTTLPTFSFGISLLLGMALGSSWGTMAIVFPLITVPTFEASGGDPIIFYGETHLRWDFLIIACFYQVLRSHLTRLKY
jgi:TRAP-type C4-dicarboxylate transport system permease large subunit